MSEIREIIGNTTATPNPCPDWNQNDSTKADYIKNKPDVVTKGDTISDSTVAYIKTVPENTAGYATATKIGGMTYRDGDTLKFAPVTEVESVGANLWDRGDVSGTRMLPQMLNLPAGTYTIGCLVTSSDTDASKSRINIVTADGSKALLFNRGVWESQTFTVSKDITTVEFSASTSNGLSDGDTFTCKEIALYKGAVTLPYIPYAENTLPIPAEVQALGGYGWGVNDTCYNYVDYETKRFIKRVGKYTVDTVTDESSYNSKYANITYYRIPKPTDAMSYGKNTNDNFLSRFPIVDMGASWDNADYFYTINGTAVRNFYWVGFPKGTTLDAAKSTLVGTEIVYELAEPVITDISDLLYADNLVEVEGGGTLTFKNEYNYAVPSDVSFYEGNNEIVRADTFVGDVIGTAARAIAGADGKKLATQEWVLEQLAALLQNINNTEN